MASMTSLMMVRAEAWKAFRDSLDLQSRRAALHLITSVEHQSQKLGVLVGFYGNESPMKPDGYQRDQTAEQIHTLITAFLEDSTTPGKSDQEVEIASQPEATQRK